MIAARRHRPPGVARPIGRRPRGASIFLLVVAILAVMALLTLTLGYTTRLELQSARNFAEGMQSRVSAVTGGPPIGPVPTPDDPPVIAGGAPANANALVSLQPKIGPEYRTRITDAILDGAPNRRVPASTMRAIREFDRKVSPTTRVAPAHSFEDDLWRGSVAVSFVEDESAKINVNAIVPAAAIDASPAFGVSRVPAGPEAPTPLPLPRVDAVGRFFDLILEYRGVASARSGAQLAEAILAHRYGPDGRPGAAGVDDDGDSGRSAVDADGVDNDQDRVVDNWREASFSTTMDRLDNNRDGRIDEPGESIENDGIDNDFDGTIDEPGEGVDEPDESSSDPRLPPRGDDRPLRRLDELMSLDGWTRDVFDALAPHLTVFSVSQAGYPDRREPELGRPQIDPNTAPPEAIFRALREAFPDLPEALIGQYTVNLIDRRDPDDLPTQMTFGGVSGRLYIGYEITPLISEVCPDVPNMPGEKDNGQFVEIVNPHDRTFSLDGWRLEGAGAPVYLRGSLQPGAALVITDDADGSADPDNEAETPGMGSLYDVFGVVASGPDRRVQVEFGFDLPDARGAVRLYDPEDNPIDLFEYQGSGLTGARLSFQRPEPRLRFSRRTYATPLEFNRTAAAGDSAIVDRDAAARIERGHNQPFRSPLDLMFVSTSFAEEATGGVDPSAFADETIRRRYPNMEGTSDDNLDLGVVDVFLPGAPRRADWRALDAAVRSGSRRADATGGGFGATGARRSAASRVFDGGEAAQAREIVARNAAPPIFGRVNLNTAPGAIVASLPGMDVQTADRIVRARRRWVDETVAEQRTFGGVRPALTTEAEPSVTSAVREDEWFRSIGPQAPARWKSLADFLKDPDVWGTDSLEDRMRVMYPSSLLIAFHSQSLRVVTESLVDPRDGDDPRRASVQRAERLIGVDRGTAETVTFRYLERIEVDADALFAVPVGEAPLLAAQLFAAAGLGLDKSAASTILPADVQLDPAALTLDRSNALTRSSPPPVKNR